AAHDHAAGQPGGSAEYTFGLHDEHVPAAVLRGGQRGSQAAEAGTDDDDGEVRTGHTELLSTGARHGRRRWDESLRQRNSSGTLRESCTLVTMVCAGCGTTIR